jgi:hypothetical protein
MGLADGPPQAVFRLRNRNQMNVIGHETVRPNLDSAFFAPIGHQFHVGQIILFAKKRLLPAIPTLDDMMRQTRNDESSQSCHAEIH